MCDNLCFSGNGGNFTDFLSSQRVDDRRLTYVRVTYETDADLFLFRVQLWVEVKV